jgi:hypothetical protein
LLADCSLDRAAARFLLAQVWKRCAVRLAHGGRLRTRICTAHTLPERPLLPLPAAREGHGVCVLQRQMRRRTHRSARMCFAAPMQRCGPRRPCSRGRVESRCRRGGMSRVPVQMRMHVASRGQRCARRCRTMQSGVPRVSLMTSGCYRQNSRAPARSHALLFIQTHTSRSTRVHLRSATRTREQLRCIALGDRSAGRAGQEIQMHTHTHAHVCCAFWCALRRRWSDSACTR